MALKFKSNLPVSLKDEVEQTFGRPIFTAKDCLQLSHDIYSRTKVQISPNTLRRLFGLIKAANAPSKSTLNILATYCGFYSLSAIPESVEHEAEKEVIHRENVLNFLYDLFNEVPIQEIRKEVLPALIRNVLVLLNREPELAYTLQRQIARTLSGQTVYFEEFVHLDKLNHYYGDGLKHYMHEKKTAEAACFGYSLLVFRYWLTQEDGKLQYAFKQLQEQYPRKAKDIHLCGRYYAARFFHAHAAGQSPDAHLIEAHNFHRSNISNMERRLEFPFFEYVVSNTLVLTGRSREALYYLNHATDKYGEDPFYTRLGHYHVLHLLKGIAHMEAGERKKAERIFNRLKPSEFGFLSRKYATLLYLLLASRLKKRIHRKEELLDALIEETGFTRFHSILDRTKQAMEEEITKK